ncbi:MAG: SUMF1/EgtB/PvdO family nonheme iron enzyme [Alistipes sp.]|jgi:formylglycine-generating enzyme required for sulfatase activity|nr:SUMF1/EgtB/PvdO family nonheme iron enzyme [Alistipes sp.]
MNKRSLFALAAISIALVACNPENPGDKPVAVEGVTISTPQEEAITMNVGDEFTFEAALEPLEATNNKMTWSTSNADAVTIDPATGEAVAVAATEEPVTITVTTEEGDFEDTVEVTVSVPVETILISPVEMVVTEGETKAFTAEVQPAEATNKEIEWSSDDDTVATVDQQGNVTGVKAGNTTINVVAKDGSGVTNSRSVMVKAAFVPPAIVQEILADMVDVLGGTFELGTGEDANNATHEVTLSNFKIGKFEVTQRQYEEVTGKTLADMVDLAGNGMPGMPIYGEGDDYPIYYLNRTDAQAFIDILCEISGWMNFRLPTEAEWEYAARGGNISEGYQFSGSDDANAVSWNGDNAERTSHPVGQKAPNELGLYDMTGNVLEWVSDTYGPYPTEPQTDPFGAETGNYGVLRGGSFFLSAATSSYYLVNSYRGNYLPTARNIENGFRVVLAE